MDSLKQAWLILLLALVFGGGLAMVQLNWGPKIEQNKENAALGAIPGIVPGASLDVPPATAELSVGPKRYKVYRVFDAQGQLAGWAIKARGSGYAGDIELLVGLDAQADTITGLDVIAQVETPGLGNKIDAPAWRDNWAGLQATQPVQIVKGDAMADQNEVLALSGATISSESVATIVNAAIDDFKANLPQLLQKMDLAATATTTQPEVQE